MSMKPIIASAIGQLAVVAVALFTAWDINISDWGVGARLACASSYVAVGVFVYAWVSVDD